MYTLQSLTLEKLHQLSYIIMIYQILGRIIHYYSVIKAQLPTEMK